MTTPASAIKDELDVLIDIQIETFGQATRLTSSQLREFHDRSDAIRMLCQELNRIGTERYGTAAGEGILARAFTKTHVIGRVRQTVLTPNLGRTNDEQV